MLIDKSYLLPFPVGQTYMAWVSSDTVIAPATRMDIRPTVGGAFQLFVENEEINANGQGLFDIVEPDARLRYTWQWNNESEITVIDVWFKPVRDRTEVRIRHTGFAKQEKLDNYDRHWDNFFDGFIAHLTEISTSQPNPS